MDVRLLAEALGAEIDGIAIVGDRRPN